MKGKGSWAHEQNIKQRRRHKDMVIIRINEIQSECYAASQRVHLTIALILLMCYYVNIMVVLYVMVVPYHTIPYGRYGGTIPYSSYDVHLAVRLDITVNCLEAQKSTVCRYHFTMVRV